MSVDLLPCMAGFPVEDADARPSYYERFKEAFVTEVNEFTACVLDDKRKFRWYHLHAII